MGTNFKKVKLTLAVMALSTPVVVLYVALAAPGPGHTDELTLPRSLIGVAVSLFLSGWAAIARWSFSDPVCENASATEAEHPDRKPATAMRPARASAAVIPAGLFSLRPAGD